MFSKDESKKISIIIPVYNGELYIKECIESVINQSYKNIEIIVVDDGSTDNTYEILKPYKNIKYIYQNNQGVSVARNKGIREATGEYIVFCDSDDIVSPDYVEVLFKNRDEKGTVIVGFHTIKADFCWNQKKKDRFKVYINTEQFLELLNKNYIQGPTCKLFKRAVLIEEDIYFDEKMNYGEDFKFVLGYINKFSFIYVVPVEIYFYRLENQNSLTSKINTNRILSFDMLNKTLYDFIQHNMKLSLYYYNSTFMNYCNFCLLIFSSEEKWINRIKLYRQLRDVYGVEIAKRKCQKENIGSIRLFAYKLDNVIVWNILGIMKKIRNHINLFKLLQSKERKR